MAYAARDDWVGDRHFTDPDPHHRLLLDRDGRPAVACMQDFDYFDYDARLILSPDAWPTRDAAEAALMGITDLIEVADDRVLRNLAPDIRQRRIAALVREYQSEAGCPGGADCERHRLGHKRTPLTIRHGGISDVADLVRPGMDLTYLPLTDAHLAALANGERVVIVVPADDPADEVTVVLTHAAASIAPRPFRTGGR